MSRNSSLTQSLALEVSANPIPATDVARSYLETELKNIIGENITSDNGTLQDSLSALNNDQIMRLLEATSYAYRMNGVFHTVTNKGNTWLDTKLPIDAITLTGTKPHINDIVYSPAIANRPIAFADYLRDYFDIYPEAEEDPELLNEFRPRSDIEAIMSSRILTSEHTGTIDIVDGMHRLMTSAILGAVSIRAYSAIPNDKEAVGMMGDSTFLTMRVQYETAASDEERSVILKATILLARSSVDGESAIRAYWINHSQDEATKSTGSYLIQQLTAAR